MPELDWSSFVTSVMTDFASGMSLDDINAKYHNHSIEGRGEVLRIELGSDDDEHPYCFAQIRMPSVHFELPGNSYGSVDFLALGIDADDSPQWHDVQTNDTIRFSTKIRSRTIPFPPIEITPRGEKKRFDLLLGTESSQLVEIVDHASNSVLDICLYAILPTQKPGELYWYFADRSLSDQERRSLRSELNRYKITDPYEGTIRVGGNCTIDVSFLGLERDPDFGGGHACLRGYHEAASDILWRLSRAADLTIDISGDVHIVTYPNRVDDFNRVSKTSLALDASDIDAAIQDRIRN